MKRTFWDNYADRQMQTIEHYEEKKRQADKLVWFKDKLATSGDENLVKVSKIATNEQLTWLLDLCDKPSEVERLAFLDHLGIILNRQTAKN